MFAKLSRILLSPANWLGLTVAIAVLVLKALGLVGLAGLPLALFGYVAGFVAVVVELERVGVPGGSRD